MGAAGVVFAVVLGVQLAFVAAIGTDIPFYDQWDVEGRWLYPAWREGHIGPLDLLRPLNEHRIAWTHALNLALFWLNGQWDPLVQQAAIALLRALCAAGLAWALARSFVGWGKVAMTGGVVTAFLPHLAWHSVTWGIESQVYFALGFSLAALACLADAGRSLCRWGGGVLFGGAALLAMAPAALVPVALLGLAVVKTAERRRFEREQVMLAAVAAGWLLVAFLARPAGEGASELRPANGTDFVVAAGRTLAWPHTSVPLAALAMNLPLVWLIVARIRHTRTPVSGEDFVLVAGGWAAAVALATAWARGGGAEMSAGVPSRYVDFLVLLPLANAWCACVLAREALTAGRRRAIASGAVAVWLVFALAGWGGLSAEVMQRLVIPRARDRDAPVRLAQAFQRTGDVAVFAGQPRLLVPHPHPESSVLPVLNDPRLRGALPPSLQLEEKMGPLSRAVRWLLVRETPRTLQAPEKR